MANVERGAGITNEMSNTLSNREHAATAGSACMRWRKCVFVRLCVCVCMCMHVRTCVRACMRAGGMRVRLATWGGDGRPSALVHEVRKSHFVGQPSGEAALEI